MSEIKVNSIKGTGASTAAITVNSSDGTCTANVTSLNGGQFANRNKIINGAMQIAQRGTSITTGDNASHFLMDRWILYCQNTGSRFTVTQSTDTPDGFGNSLKIDCTTADTSLASNEEVQFWQKIEGFNTQDFAKGTSAAKQYTLSFYVKTNKTGTYIVRLLGRDNINSCVSASYTVSDTNWNRYTVTFPANTNFNHADNNDNGEALRVVWWLVAGSTVQTGDLATVWKNSSDAGAATGQVNFADSTSNDFLITGCQLEVGSVATDFEHRSYGQELELCKRYYQVILDRSTDSGDDSGLGGTVYVGSAGALYVPIRFSPQMRSSPTVESSNNGNEFRTRHGDLVNFDNFTGFNTVSRRGGTLIASASGNKTVGHFYWIETDQGSAKLAVVAEL